MIQKEPDMLKLRKILAIDGLRISPISLNKAYIHFNPKAKTLKGKYTPIPLDGKIKKMILNDLVASKIKAKPLDITRVEAIIAGKSDLDNNFKTVLDAVEDYLITNDRLIRDIKVKSGDQGHFAFFEEGEQFPAYSLPISKMGSANGKWLGRTIKLTRVAKKFKSDLSIISRFSKLTSKPTKKPVMVYLEAGLRSVQDLDNIFKLIFDSLIGIIYGDDRQICYIHAVKKVVKTKQQNYLTINIYEVEDEEINGFPDLFDDEWLSPAI